ncbi:hypothetical protein GE061_012223 [Apolygus lucorum]|uniref:Uncharacterized protein n=1 Tax=Apolygus lucorum TaxID=248454 RepID=A0A8S9XT16_APOLU|nr:hypothetical protein GE061_012223 [Apolygus lucorum]
MFPGGRPQNMQPGGGQPPMVQYPGMYYSSNASASAWPMAVPKDEGHDVLAESYERMRREMRSLQGGTPSNAPPPPSMDSSRDNAAIKMLLNNENVSLSSLLEAAMDPSTDRSGQYLGILSLWNCPEVKLDTCKRKKAAETIIEESSKPKRDKSPALEAAEEFANKPNPSMSTNLFSFESEPIPGQIPVIGPKVKDVIPMVDLTKPPPLINPYPDPPADPYATTAFELWAEIERERRHKEKMKEWEFGVNPYSLHQPGLPGDQWSASSGWPSGASHVPENYSGSQMYPGGADYYYGNSGPIPPYNMPPNYYGMRPSYHPPRYPIGGPPRGPPMWGSRGPPPYGYRPPPPTPSKSVRPKPVELKTKGKLLSSRNVVELPLSTKPSEVTVKKSASVSKVATPVKNPKIESSGTPTTEVIVLDDEKLPKVEPVPKTDVIAVVHPPGVSPDRELPPITNNKSSDKESDFTKPMRAKFRELLKPLEKILDTLKFRQRDCEEFKPLIKGLEIGACEFDGVYTLVEGILCRVVIDAKESSKTCFKIVLSPVHVTPILMEIHKMYHDWTSYRIKRTLEELFYDSRLFPSWKIGNVIAICKECKSERRKREEKESVKPKSHEKDEGENLDKGKSQSRSRSHRRRSESKDRDDKKKSRRGSKDDQNRPEKSELHRDKKRELKDVKKGDDVKEASSKMEDTSKQTADRPEKEKDSAVPVRKLLKIQFEKVKLGSKGEVANNVVTGTDSNLGKVEGNHSESVEEKKVKPTQPESVPSKKIEESPKSVEASHKQISGTSSMIGDTEAPTKPLGKLLVPYVKPEDFKVRVRNAQLMMDDLKTHIQNLEGPSKKATDPSYLLKAGMLCKRTTNKDGKNEVKIAVTPQSLLKMIQIVHTMATTHAPLEKTISVFNKHFTQILGVQEAVTIVLNNCEECGSS